MSLCLDITQANTGRLAERKESANLPAKLFSYTWATLRIEIKNRVGRCVTISRRLNETSHHRVTDNEKFAS
jgi:hypothetical protein